LKPEYDLPALVEESDGFGYNLLFKKNELPWMAGFSILKEKE